MSLATEHTASERRRILALRPHAIADIIDRAALAGRLAAIGDRHAADAGGMRKAAVEVFRDALEQGREKARAWLEADGGGLDCAQNLSRLEDEPSTIS
jgi:[protein-PII] uridylyltransferase